jgi:hypothetical protein
VLPRAPTPPATARASRRREDSRSRSEYTAGSVSQFTAISQRHDNERSETQPMQSPIDFRHREHANTRTSSQEYHERRTDTQKPAYEKDVDRGRTRNSPERYEVREQSTDKHVTFRDSISERSPVKEWSEDSRKGVR